MTRPACETECLICIFAEGENECSLPVDAERVLEVWRESGDA